jgi:hypothetical protein
VNIQFFKHEIYLFLCYFCIPDPDPQHIYYLFASFFTGYSHQEVPRIRNDKIPEGPHECLAECHHIIRPPSHRESFAAVMFVHRGFLQQIRSACSRFSCVTPYENLCRFFYMCKLSSCFSYIYRPSTFINVSQGS